MARIASGVNACCYRHVPYDFIKNAIWRHSAANRRKMLNVSPSHWTILFSSISLLSLHILRSFFFVYCFFTNRVTISYLNCIHSNSTLRYTWGNAVLACQNVWHLYQIIIWSSILLFLVSDLTVSSYTVNCLLFRAF